LSGAVHKHVRSERLASRCRCVAISLSYSPRGPLMKTWTTIVLCAGALAAGDVAAVTLALADEPAGKLLTGKAAFGDWRSDRPGVRRLLKLADLPAPFATESAA